MRNLVEVFGDRPQVRLIEAALAMAPYEFTRAELAAEAGLWKPSANRLFPELERLRLVRQVSDGDHPKYAVVNESKLLAVLQSLEPALAMAMRADESLAQDLNVPELFQQRVAAVVTAPIVIRVEGNTTNDAKTRAQRDWDTRGTRTSTVPAATSSQVTV